MIKIDKNNKIISELISTGNFFELENYIFKENKDISRPSLTNKKQATRLLDGFINKSKLKNHLILLFALDFSNQTDNELEKTMKEFQSYIKFLINYDINSRIKKLLVKFCQKSYTLKLLLQDKISDESILRVLLQILSEVNRKID